MAVPRSRPVEQVYNRKETTWYENHAVRFSQSGERIENRARDRQPIRGISDVSDDTACKGVQTLAPPGSLKNIWDKKTSPLWVYVSPSISQTNNKLRTLFENKIIDIFLYIHVPRCSQRHSWVYNIANTDSFICTHFNSLQYCYLTWIVLFAHI